jgi:hypothetical protein
MAGPAHSATAAIEEQMFRAAQERQREQQEKAMAAVKAGKPVPPQYDTRAEQRERSVQYISARVVKLTPAKLDDRSVSTPEELTEVLADRRFDWLLNQLDAAISSREGFISSSSPT